MEFIFSPARFTPFYPAYTDPTFIALTALSVFLFLRNSYLLSLLLIVAAYPIREAALFVLFFLAVEAIYIEGWSKQLLFKIIGAIAFILVIKFSIRHYYLCDGSQMRTAISWIYQRLANPERFVSYCAAILMTAGPILHSKPITTTKIHRIYISGLILSAGLAFLGGSDATRIFIASFRYISC